MQGTATKLILNCWDEKTAGRVVGLIRKQERIDSTYSFSGGRIFGRTNVNEQIREVYVMMPTEPQAQQSLQEYLGVADGSLPAKVTIKPQQYLVQVERLVLST